MMIERVFEHLMFGSDPACSVGKGISCWKDSYRERQLDRHQILYVKERENTLLVFFSFFLFIPFAIII